VRLHHHRLAGLHIESEIALPGLPTIVSGAGTAAVSISRSKLDDYAVENAVLFSDGCCNSRELLLEIPEVTRFLIRDGRQILIDQMADADSEDVLAYLLGSAFGILCHQRGILPLHAATIASEEGDCVAFAGDSGTGKSTLVAALAKRGQRVISDDVSFLTKDSEEHSSAWPGIARIRLWEDALMALKPSGPEAVREFRAYNKFVLPLVRGPELEEPKRLRRLYQLTSTGNDRHSIRRLRGASAFDLILLNVYRAEYAEAMGLKSLTFERCASLARQTAVFEFDRPRGLDRLDEGVDFLLRHLAESL
jgi:hypothetical protein